MKVGVLALQGNFAAHQRALAACGASVILVKKASEVPAVSALVLPGGESTAMLRLMDADLRRALTDAIRAGLPTLATCAGLILLAREVTNPAQDSLALLDVAVSRNAYGRQVDSFVHSSLHWTDEGKTIASRLTSEDATSTVEGVFIRAPRITRIGAEARSLLEREGEPVLVAQQNIFGASFHPELSAGDLLIHRLLLSRA